jgi:thioredoxin reductase (NADPH)
MAERVLHNEKIRVIWNAVVMEIMDVAKGDVTAIRLRDTRTNTNSEIAMNGVFMAIGHTPNTTPFRNQVTLDADGYIVSDRTRTNLPGVFAAGDVQDRTYRQAVTAAGTGCMAALEVERFLASQE